MLNSSRLFVAAYTITTASMYLSPRVEYNVLIASVMLDFPSPGPGESATINFIALHYPYSI